MGSVICSMLAGRVAATLDLVFVPGPRLIIYVAVAVVLGVAFVTREILLDAAAYVWEVIVNRKTTSTRSARPPLDPVAAALQQIGQRDASFTRDGFLQQASQTISQVQRARTELTPELARERLADSAWQQLSRQVGQAGTWRERVVPTGTVRSVKVVDAHCEPNQDVITVRSVSVEDSARSAAIESSRLVQQTIEDWTFNRNQSAGQVVRGLTFLDRGARWGSISGDRAHVAPGRGRERVTRPRRTGGRHSKRVRRPPPQSPASQPAVRGLPSPLAWRRWPHGREPGANQHDWRLGFSLGASAEPPIKRGREFDL